VTQTVKRSTGIPGLDLTLDGGFPVGGRIVVYGSPLSGLHLMAKQFWRTESDDTGSYLMLDADVEPGMVDAGRLSTRELAASLEGDRIVVDSLSTLLLRDGMDAAYEFFTQAARSALERQANIMYILYQGLHTPWEEARLMRAADIFIILREELHGNEFERTLAVQKIRGMQVPQRVVPFHMMPKGLELSTTSRVV